MSKLKEPKYIFETSWEVCNKVGGIYTVLSTRARTLYSKIQDNLIFIGPDVWTATESPFFVEDTELYKDWRADFNAKTDLKIRIGRWSVEGSPVAVLVDFNPLFAQRDEIYGAVWEDYRVDSLYAYGDYDESSLFGYATGMVMESFYKYHNLKKADNVVAHFNEWMTTFGAFYVQKNVPEIATVFTTHATSIGRSIAGNNKPLYNNLKEYNGDQMAYELNMVSKHSTEKTAAHIADCFTTVSDITAMECEQLLERRPDIVTPNGFEDDFVPSGRAFTTKRNVARKKMVQVAETLFGYKLKKETVFVVTAGRYEYKNKGIDVFIDSLKRLSMRQDTTKEVVAFIMVPAHQCGAREDLIHQLENPNTNSLDSWNKKTTHDLFDYENDNVISALRWFQFENREDEKVKVIFVPSYLNGNDGIFNLSYWDLLLGFDVSVFPSYYEPWGYTPLESIAFSVPTITTDLSGFGQWMNSYFEGEEGVSVVHRSDYNQSEVCDEIVAALINFMSKNKTEMTKIRENAFQTSKNILWKQLIKYYHEAYDIALQKRNDRLKTEKK